MKKIYPFIIILFLVSNLLSNNIQVAAKTISDSDNAIFTKYLLGNFQDDYSIWQDLLQKKHTIDSLYVSNNKHAAKDLIRDELEIVDTLVSQNKLLMARETCLILKELFNYSDLQNLVIFKEIDLLCNLSQYKIAEELLRKINITDTSGQKRVNNLLQKVLFEQDKFQPVIELDKNFQGKRDSDYKLRLAKSFYGLRRYQESFDISSANISDGKNTFEFQILTGLGVRKLYSDKSALDYFDVMLAEIHSLDRNLKLLLIKARIYYSEKDYKQALEIYQKYVDELYRQDPKNRLSDKLSYEIGWTALKAGEFTLAKRSFQFILSKSQRSNYYSKSNNSYAILLAKQKNYDQAKTVINGENGKYVKFLEILENKKELLNIYRELVDLYPKILENEKKSINPKSIEEVKNSIHQANGFIINYTNKFIEPKAFDGIFAFETELLNCNDLIIQAAKSKHKINQRIGNLTNENADIYKNKDSLLVRKQLRKNIEFLTGTLNEIKNLKSDFSKLNQAKFNKNERLNNESILGNKTLTTLLNQNVNNDIGELDNHIDRISLLLKSISSESSENLQSYMQQETGNNNFDEISTKDKFIKLNRFYFQEISRILDILVNQLKEEEKEILKKHNILANRFQDKIHRIIEANEFALADIENQEELDFNKNYREKTEDLIEKKEELKSLFEKRNKK